MERALQADAERGVGRISADRCVERKEQGEEDADVIGKVIRGTDVGRLLYCLYGPGRANEHTDPHPVAAFGDPVEPEPKLRRSGLPDLRRLSGLLAQPLAAALVPNSTSQCGTARCGQRPVIARSPLPSGRKSRQGSWPRPGLHQPTMSRESGGSRSGTRRTTFTSSLACGC